LVNDKTRKSLVLGIIISLLLFNFISVDWVKGDEATANPSTYHKAYEFQATSDSAWGTTGTEHTVEEYNAIATSDDSRDYFQDDGNSYWPYERVDFNIGRIADANSFVISDISNINIVIEGYGTYIGTFCAVYDDTDATWRNTNSSEINGVFTHSTTNADGLLDFDINGSIDDYISSDNILKVSVRGGKNVGGVSGIYIDAVTLTITYSTLTSPVLVSPTNGGTGYTITPNFDWNVSTGGTSPYTYEIMVDTDLAFGSPDINATGISDSNYSYTTGLTPNTTYYWKVRTLDAGSAYSAWTSTYAFTTAPFVAPTFTMPTSGMSITTATPTFSWSASTGGSGTYTYELMVSLNSGFTTTVVNQTGIATTSYAMTSNLTPDIHYAKLRALDSLGNYSDWTSTITFTAVAPSSGGPSSSTSTQEEYVPYTAPVTTNNDTVTTTSTGGSTSVLNKYIFNPVKVIFIDPLRALWNYIIGLFHFSGQNEIIDIMKTPVGVDEYKLPLGVILAGALILILSFGDGIKMPKFKLGKRKRRKGKR
jgi:hypothetical protein